MLGGDNAFMGRGVLTFGTISWHRVFLVFWVLLVSASLDPGQVLWPRTGHRSVNFVFILLLEQVVGAPVRQWLSCCRGTRVSLLVPTSTRGQGQGHMSLSWGEKARGLLHLCPIPGISQFLVFHQPLEPGGCQLQIPCSSPVGDQDPNKALETQKQSPQDPKTKPSAEQPAFTGCESARRKQLRT